MSRESDPARVCSGRQGAAQRVVSILDGTDETKRGSVLLLGGRGVGRTTLMNAALAAADADPIRLLGLTAEATSDYASLVHAWDGSSGRPEITTVAAMVSRGVLEAAAGATHEVGRRLLASLRESTGGRRVVLAVDDVHLFDRASQQVVTYLAHHGAAVGLHTLLTADEAADLSHFAGVDRIRVATSGVRGLRLLLEQTLGVSLPSRVATLLHTWSGGNPALAVDLGRQLRATDLRGETPIALPLVPTAAAAERLGQRLGELSPDQRRLLAVFALCRSLPVELLQAVGHIPATVVDELAAEGWLTVHQRVVEPSRRGEALIAWSTLPPSLQSELCLRLADQLGTVQAGRDWNSPEQASPEQARYEQAGPEPAGPEPPSPELPATADYFAALGGDPSARTRLVGRIGEFYTRGQPELAAAAAALVLRQGTELGPQQSLMLGRMLTADGYVVAGRQLSLLPVGAALPPTERLEIMTDLATMTSDPTEALAHVLAVEPPVEGLDGWLRAMLSICRVQLALDGPSESGQLVDLVLSQLPTASAETRALTAVVAAERDVYREAPGSPATLGRALDRWLAVRDNRLELNTVSAVLDLLGLGRLAAARELVSTVGSLQRLPFATSRSALLTVRTETEIAAGHFRRAAALLFENDREHPSPHSSDLMLTTQAIRIGTVCDDLSECRVIEDRLNRSQGLVLSYPARRGHTAALGFRELVHGNYRQSHDLLLVALRGPALLLQGRTGVLADLVEATAAHGDRRGAAELLAHYSQWLPDRDGTRSPGLLARCRAIVGDLHDVDRLFGEALDAQAPTHQTDRARTLLSYGRALLAANRGDDARRPLGEAAELFRESRLPGWERHVARLRAHDGLAAGRSPAPVEIELTETEHQVLSLVMQQRRNREIAETMFVSLRTVEGHLTRIFRKLGVSTKAQLFRQLSADPRVPRAQPRA